jgi:hypothetical protein
MKMADNSATTEAPQQPQTPNPALSSLDRLVGTWNVSGQSIEGKVTFEWMEGGFFLIQYADFVHDGHKIKGIEIIGYDEASNTLKSHYFGNSPEVLEYAWEISDDTLRIWYGEKGSPAVFTGKFSEDGNSNTGAWEWPGGGYESTMTRAGTA